MTSTALSPLPVAAGRFRNTRRFVSDPITLLSDLSARHGDIFRLDLLNGPLVALTHPRHLRCILQERMSNFTRNTDSYAMIEPFMGRGLATIADHAKWRRNRRLAQPAFHHTKIAALGEVMTAAVERTADAWSEIARSGTPIVVNDHMSRLTLDIVLQALFGMEPDSPELRRFAVAAHHANTELGRFIRAPFVPLKVPTPGHRRFWRSIAELDAIVYGLIARFRSDATPNREGLLPMFMDAVDADTGEKLSDKELRDEVITMLFAGHETSALTLTWTLLLMHEHPETLRKVRDEAAETLSGRTATMADLAQLPYAKQVLDEVLRLYPPGWQAYRCAEEDDMIGDYPIAAGSQIIYSIYHAHRQPEFWRQPLQFDPDRFTPSAVAERDRHAYLPFGIGGHMCIGNVFALTEMQIALSTLLARFHLTIPNPDLTPASLLTLNTKTPVVAFLTERR
ncbi:MAG: cytochrome P450 [Mycobacteriaceae bacterium]|nr:cytochrome P450 [Mycobacteriaceae bacterium]